MKKKNIAERVVYNIDVHYGPQEIRACIKSFI